MDPLNLKRADAIRRAMTEADIAGTQRPALPPVPPPGTGMPPSMAPPQSGMQPGMAPLQSGSQPGMAPPQPGVMPQSQFARGFSPEERIRQAQMRAQALRRFGR